MNSTLVPALRRTMSLGFAVVVLWTLYWAIAGWGIRSGLSAWFAAQSSRGWQVEVHSIEPAAPLGGFPLEHRSRITLPALADPGSGTAWSADWLELQSPALWPGRQTLRFADGDQRLSHFDKTAVIRTEGLTVDLNLAPGLALQVKELSLRAGAWSIGDGQHVNLSAADISVAMQQGKDAALYHITAGANGFRPGEDLRRLLRAAPKLPQSFETLTLTMDVRFDTAWSRAALEERRPQPREIDLGVLEARWGAMRLKAAGRLHVDERGMPEGKIALQVEAWAEFLDMAADAGLISQRAHDQAERLVALLAQASGNPQDLDVTLGLRDGLITLGPIPIGTAPRLILR